MKRLLFLFILLPSLSFAQKQGQARIDSLLKELPRIKKDTSLVVVLCDLVHSYSGISTDDGMKYATQAMALAKKLGYKPGIIKSLLVTGNVNEDIGQYDAAVTNYTNALKMAEESGDKASIAKCYGNIGNAYTGLTRYDDALKYLEKALKMLQETGDTKDFSIAACYANIGNTHGFIGNTYYQKKDTVNARKEFQEAMDNTATALKMYQDGNRKTEIISCYINLSQGYLTQSKYPEALEALYSALKTAEEIKNKKLTAHAYLGIAYVLFRQENYAEAEKLCNKGLAIAEEIGAIDLISRVNSFLGTIQKTTKGKKDH